jgi:hypothetical protein
MTNQTAEHQTVTVITRNGTELTGKWSNSKDVPTLGRTVRVNFNQFGKGGVQDYRLVDGFICCIIRLEVIPRWYQSRVVDSRYMNAFGAELDLA